MRDYPPMLLFTTLTAICEQAIPTSVLMNITALLLPVPIAAITLAIAEKQTPLVPEIVPLPVFPPLPFATPSAPQTALSPKIPTAAAKAETAAAARVVLTPMTAIVLLPVFPTIAEEVVLQDAP